MSQNIAGVSDNSGCLSHIAGVSDNSGCLAAAARRVRSADRSVVVAVVAVAGLRQVVVAKSAGERPRGGGAR